MLLWGSLAASSSHHPREVEDVNKMTNRFTCMHLETWLHWHLWAKAVCLKTALPKVQVNHCSNKEWCSMNGSCIPKLTIFLIEVTVIIYKEQNNLPKIFSRKEALVIGLSVNRQPYRNWLMVVIIIRQWNKWENLTECGALIWQHGSAICPQYKADRSHWVLASLQWTSFIRLSKFYGKGWEPRQ